MKELARAASKPANNFLNCGSTCKPLLSYFKPPQLITHCEVRTLPFSSTQFQHVAIDVPNYSKFVPYCQKSEIKKSPKPHIGDTEGLFVASITVGFMALQVTYLSKVWYKPGIVEISKYEKETMFKELKCEWMLEDLGPKKCKLKYCIHFMFANPIYNSMAKAFRELVAHEMNKAFIEQAKKLYGTDSKE